MAHSSKRPFLSSAVPSVPVAQSGRAYKYFLSLPERVVRSLSVLSGGLLREIGNLIVPAAIRRSTLYRTMVEVTLRFLIEEVGQVEGIYPSQEKLAENFLLKRTAGHGIELLGILTFHASPIWVLAALADATGGSRKLMQELSLALKDEGLLPPESRFDTMEQILSGLETTSKHLAATCNLPPLSLSALRREWRQLKLHLATIPPAKIPSIERIEKIWSDIQAAAQSQHQSVFKLSSLLAISAITHVPSTMLWLSRAARSSVRRTGSLLGDTILTHYTNALSEIARSGVVAYWKREFKPYLKGAAEQFAPEHGSLTERWLNRTFRPK